MTDRLPRTVDYPEGVRTVDLIEESGPLVALRHEVDLDDLMVALAQEHPGHWRDEATYVAGGYSHSNEAAVGWYRKQPCSCGGDHGWDMAEVSRDEKPTDRRRYGAFLGVYIA
jgi:hypothetical protein